MKAEDGGWGYVRDPLAPEILGWVASFNALKERIEEVVRGWQRIDRLLSHEGMRLSDVCLHAPLSMSKRCLI